MNILDHIQLKNKEGKNIQYRLFGIPIFEKLESEKNKEIRLLFNKKRKKIDKEKPVFYLKINSTRYFSLPCLQNWINIVEKMDCDYYIISDNPKITESIKKNIIFPNDDIKIIKSCRSQFLRKIASKTANKAWTNAALAHLTTFLHSKKIGAKHFWNIDADDTVLLGNVDLISNLLLKIQDYAIKNQINIFSLDMWYSWCRGKHWTFGITYTQNNINWFKILKSVRKKWLDNYPDYSWKDPKTIVNLDLCYTYLRDFKRIKAETFYLENMWFIHFCDFAARLRDNGICYWKNGFVHYPLYTRIFKPVGLQQLKIPQDAVKFITITSEKECIDFYKKYIRKR